MRRLIAGWLRVSVLAAAGAAHAHSETPFEVASVRPSNPDQWASRLKPTARAGLSASGVTLRELVQFAYDMHAAQVVGGPKWFDRQRWEVQAKSGADADPADPLQSPDRTALLAPVRARTRLLLAERFRLVVHQQQRNVDAFVLVVEKGGHRMRPPAPNAAPGMRGSGRGAIHAGSATMTLLSTVLASMLGRPVVNRTNLNGGFAFDLEWTPESYETPGAGNLPPLSAPALSPGADGPSLFTALRQQLGLRLVSGKTPLDVIVIDRAELPDEN